MLEFNVYYFSKLIILEKEKKLILNVKLQPVHSYLLRTLLAKLVTQLISVSFSLFILFRNQELSISTVRTSVAMSGKTYSSRDKPRRK